MRGNITIDEKHKAKSFLLSKKRDVLKKQEIDLGVLVHKIHLSRIPKEVIDIFNNKDFKGYFSYTISASKLIGIGFDHDYVNLKDKEGNVSRVPFKDSNVLNLTKKESEKIRPLFDKFKNTKKEVEELSLEIEGVLNSLKSRKKISEQFPELKPLFEKNQVLLPATYDVDDLRKRINN